jgi:hypothetical protein
MDHPMDYVTYRSLEYFNYEMVESYSYGVWGGNLFQIEFILIPFLVKDYCTLRAIGSKDRKVTIIHYKQNDKKVSQQSWSIHHRSFKVSFKRVQKEWRRSGRPMSLHPLSTHYTQIGFSNLAFSLVSIDSIRFTVNHWVKGTTSTSIIRCCFVISCLH